MTRLRTAIYESWKPVSHSQNGLKQSSKKADAARELNMEVFLPLLSPATMNVNIIAERNTDGDPPARMLKIHKPAMMISGLAIRVL